MVEKCKLRPGAAEVRPQRILSAVSRSHFSIEEKQKILKTMLYKKKKRNRHMKQPSNHYNDHSWSSDIRQSGTNISMVTIQKPHISSCTAFFWTSISDFSWRLLRDLNDCEDKSDSEWVLWNNEVDFWFRVL